MRDFIEEPAFEISRRVEIRGTYAWFVVLKPAEDTERTLEDFIAELSAVLDRPVRIVPGMTVPLERLRIELHQSAGDPVVIPDLDQADADRWRALDVNRSGYLRRGPVVLWLSSVGLTSLCEFAPNIRSFIGGSIFYLGANGEAMTVAECKQRISELELHFNMTSADVILRAESGTLPTEPHFVEWLVLLGRGDLV
jgi:hypothetical protein